MGGWCKSVQVVVSYIEAQVEGTRSGVREATMDNDDKLENQTQDQKEGMKLVDR